MTYLELFGQNLRRIRTSAGLSQEGLMEISEIHRTQISKYERGETDPQAEVLLRLAGALGVSISDFFIGVGWRPNPSRVIVEPGPDDRDAQPGRPQAPRRRNLIAL